MTYDNMTAVELHDLVTRLEAHGFVLPEGLALSKNVWGNMLVLYSETPVDEQFAAAIIEVAARNWWIARDRASNPPTTYEWLTFTHDVAYGDGVTMYATDWEQHELGEGPTPLHAIVAAVEAKEAK